MNQYSHFSDLDQEINKRTLAARILVILRWLAFLPAGYLAALVVYLFVTFGLVVALPAVFRVISEFGSVQLALYLVPAGDYRQLWLNVVTGVGNCFFGTAWVWVSAFVAPSHKRQAILLTAVLALITSALGIIISGFSGRYLDAYHDASLIIGAVVMAAYLARHSPSHFPGPLRKPTGATSDPAK
jgi:hypothetical protein